MTMTLICKPRHGAVRPCVEFAAIVMYDTTIDLRHKPYTYAIRCRHKNEIISWLYDIKTEHTVCELKLNKTPAEVFTPPADEK